MTTAVINAGSGVNAKLVVPDEVKNKFPDLARMIVASQSMDDEERKYWFSVLPIMTKEQIAELRDILETEKKKLADIDKKYASNTSPTLTAEQINALEIKKREAQAKRREEELAHQREVEDHAEDILGELDQL